MAGLPCGADNVQATIRGPCRASATPGSSNASAVFDAVSSLRKPMDLSLWLGANHSHAQWHGEDLQRRHGGKDAVLCCE